MRKINVEKIPSEFTGIGEVDGFTFTKLHENEFAYIYQVSFNDEFAIYEVFRKKVVAKSIDFKNKIFSETDFKEVYPKSKNFGDWAKCTPSLELALKYFKNYSYERK